MYKGYCNKRLKITSTARDMNVEVNMENVSILNEESVCINPGLDKVTLVVTLVHVLLLHCYANWH